MISWKYLHCPFSYLKATSNEIKTRILKFSLTIYGESEKSPGERKSYPLQYSGLDDFMDCKMHGIAKSLTILSDYNLHFQLEKNIHFSVISLIGMECGHPKNGKKWRKKRTKCCLVGEGGMGSAWHESRLCWEEGGAGMRGSECRQQWWLHSIVNDFIFPNCIN